jgi:ATP-dependent helicase/nuclease subunit B
LGEVEEDELMLSAGADFLHDVAAIPRAIPASERRVLLTRLIEQMNVPGVSKAQAYLLAGDLGRLIDEALIENCDLKNLAALVPDRYAEHWQKIIAFLAIVNQHWPLILQSRGMIDAVDYRQRLTRLLIAHWQKNPPDYPVIAAGSTGSQPVTAELLQCIAQFPNGAVVLPGLDTHLEEEAWAQISAAHPQYYLARLLRKMECGREEVQAWPGVSDGARAVLLSETMRPSEAADRWRHLKPGEINASAWQGLEVIEAAQEHEEALVAALMLRQVAGEEGRTAALITPDRDLARRVGAFMRRWNIELDDSAGTPLLETPVGSFISLLLDLPVATLRPSQLMAFLKHPFAGVGLPREETRVVAREMERMFFRDMPRGKGLKNWAEHTKRDSALKPSATLLETLYNTLQPFFSSDERPLKDWANDVKDIATALAADKNALWHEAEGERFAELLDSFGARDEIMCGFADFAEIFRAGLRECVVRRPWGQHPRLAILGLLEARLLRFDHVILGGLNEASWPQEMRPDPWMSHAMRIDLGCADPEARIGQMAHDFVQAAAGPHVALLRSKRAGDSPTIPSRWLSRLEAVRHLAGYEWPSSPWLGYARAIDFSADLQPCDPPAVSVPTKALPPKLSASAIEMWLRDPYGFYARYVLHLRALNALDGEFGARERGTLIHRALEHLAHQYKTVWPPQAENDFVGYVRKGLVDYGCSAGEVELLSARLTEMAHEYWVFEANRRAGMATGKSECKGELKLEIANYRVKLEARADRMEALKAGGLSIIDYKTTTLPAKKEIAAGLRPQLYVEAIMADVGSFKDMPPQALTELNYVCFDQNQGEVYAEPLELKPDDVENIHRPGLENFIRAYLGKEARYLAAPRPQLVDPAPDYARLARVAEWSKGAVEQEEGDA